MSEENVEAIRRGYEHFNQDGEPDWNLFHPDAELDATNVVGFGVIRGREEVLTALRDYASSFDEWQIEPEELIDAGERVFAAVRDGGRMKATGGEVFNRFFHVWYFDSGKVIAWKTFRDKDAALEAAGLRE